MHVTDGGSCSYDVVVVKSMAVSKIRQNTDKQLRPHTPLARKPSCYIMERNQPSNIYTILPYLVSLFQPASVLLVLQVSRVIE